MVMIVADVGGTNIRFARTTGLGGPLEDVTHFKCADFPGIEDAFAAYRQEVGPHDPLEAVSIAVAASVTHDHVDLTNNHWVFSKSTLHANLGCKRLLVINDFTAQALAQSDPTAHGNIPLIPGTPTPDAPLLVIGPGTGLGVSALLPTVAGHLPLEGQGGHVSFAPRSDSEAALYAFVADKQDYVSAEHVVSGGGLETIYRFVTRDMADAPAMTALEIGTAAIKGAGPCRDSAIMMLDILGTIIANNVLTVGAWGGVVVAGGIVPRLASLIDKSNFANRIRHIGNESPLTATLPVWLCVDAHAGLRGAQAGLGCELLWGREIRA